MSQSAIEGVQNVEVSKKLPCEKTLQEQLTIMMNYTKAHQDSENCSKERRELNCLKTLYPHLVADVKDHDLLVGRLDFLPIGFGCVTSIGGVGHYCVFNKLREFQKQLEDKQAIADVNDMYDYWTQHDVKSLYCKDVLTEDTIGRFIDCDYPLMATARLSGMMLHYDVLCELGIMGLKKKIQNQREKQDNEFLKASYETLEFFQSIISELIIRLDKQIPNANLKRKQELMMMKQSLTVIQTNKPRHFHEALQLIWLYAIFAGCINYGRMDDILGPFLCNDLKSGFMNAEEAFSYLVSLWTLIENRRTTVNGRIIVGGYGRKHPKEADEFVRLAVEVTKHCRYVEPQFTLRINKDTPQDILDMAYDSLGQDVTYPTLYNDEINVPAVMYGMRVDRETAEQYVPFGCGEFVIQGQSVGTPNTLLNMLKILNITLNKGIDPIDNKWKANNVDLTSVYECSNFEQFYDLYKKVLETYYDLSIHAQYYSYEVMNREVSFLFTSILMDDCIARGKALLDGGVRYLGGTNETYGNINTSDSLYAIKKLVFDEKFITLEEYNNALLKNFEGYDELYNRAIACDKYGNDIEEVDALANDLYEHVAKGIRDRGIRWNMQYYLIVISNNQTNTEWGRRTSASADGRKCGVFMNPANNPQGGASKLGPTALLNSLAKFQAKYHGGSVQNIKFSPAFFNENRKQIKAMFETYFAKGGCQLMVTIVDRGVLEDAQKHPENYPDLIVRVSGFSARFVDLEKDVQDELLSRVLYE